MIFKIKNASEQTCLYCNIGMGEFLIDKFSEHFYVCKKHLQEFFDLSSDKITLKQSEKDIINAEKL